MLPEFLQPETTIRANGNSPNLDLGSHDGATFLVTLGITRTIEQESVDISIWGSKDGSDWGSRPLASFPQKFYCGTYQISVDLSRCPEIRYLRAQWKVNRWGKSDSKPLFCVYLFAQEMKRQVMAVGAA